MASSIETLSSALGASSTTVFDVARIQRGLQLATLPHTINYSSDCDRPDAQCDDESRKPDGGCDGDCAEDFRAIVGATWPRREPLTCVWDAKTEQRVRAYVDAVNNFCTGGMDITFAPELCNKQHIPRLSITSINPSADRKRVTITGEGASYIKSAMDREIRKHGMGSSCGAVAAPSPSPSPTVTPPPPVTAGSTRIFVSALQLVAIRDGKYRAADYDCLWGRKSREAARAIRADLRGSSPYPEAEEVYQGGQVVDLFPASEWDGLAEYLATEILTVDYRPCPAAAPQGGGGADADVDEDEAPLVIEQAGMGAGGWLLLAAAAGGAYWLWRRR